MPDYQVTALSLPRGWGRRASEERTRALDAHVREISARGWKLVAVDAGRFEHPPTWRFVWERPPRNGPNTPPELV